MFVYTDASKMDSKTPERTSLGIYLERPALARYKCLVFPESSI